MYFKNFFLVGGLFGLIVIGCRAQVRVEVEFDPPSPVKQGIVTFRCNFTLPAGTVLAQQYWQIVNGDRFFEYIPGGNLSIHADYQEKILDYRTDETTYLEIDFNVTACDVEQYLCNILANSSADNSRQESLEVENLIAPVLKYGGEIISEDTTIIPTSNETVSCSLEDAGPPLPGLLWLQTSYVEPNPETDQHEQSDETCTWIYPNPLEFFVDVTDFNNTAYFQCWVDYVDRDSKYSPVFTLTSNVTTTTQEQTTAGPTTTPPSTTEGEPTQEQTTADGEPTTIPASNTTATAPGTDDTDIRIGKSNSVNEKGDRENQRKKMVKVEKLQP